MKKKTVALMLSVMMALGAAGCGSDKDGSVDGSTEAVESTEAAGADNTADTSVTSLSGAFDLKGSDYVKLCDYNAINVTITGDYDVDDEAVQEYFKSMFESYGPFYTEDTDKTTIGEGDIVNVDYVGKLDGVAFNGGTAENQNIDVYANGSPDGATTYIEGFTDGLKGASVGDVIDCDVTFPENYGNADLAGKAVVFTFTVNSIQKEMNLEDVDDNFAKEQFDVDTVDEMYEQIRSYMEQSAEYNKNRDTYLAVQDYLVDNCEVDVPEDYLTARVADYKRQFIEQNCGGDESQLEDFLANYYGKTTEEMEEYWNEGMEKSIRLELVMDAIAEELGIEADEEELSAYAQQLVTQNGYESVEAMYNIYGYGDTAYGERYFRDLYLYDIALDKIVENVTVTVEEPAALEDAADTDAADNGDAADGTEETESTEEVTPEETEKE